jgi:hypothetical protein
MGKVSTVLVTEYRQRHENVLLFYDCKFLILPTTEVKQVDEGLEITEDALAAAFDLTPDLPCKVLCGAWRRKIVFASDVSRNIGWAASVAQGVPGLSAHDILNAFIGGIQ